jgi:hypothetical protein
MGAVEGIRAVVYPARDLGAAVVAWTAMLGHGPVWESPDYVAFDAGGAEVGLSRLPWFEQPVVFWKVADIEAAWAGLVAGGGTALGETAGGTMAEVNSAEVVNGDPKTGIVTVPGRKLAVVRAADDSLVGLMQDLPAAW